MTDNLHLQIAKALTPAGKPVYLPTDEQLRIIEAPIAPALVVAGAGSGKTHTMVLRMLWLIASKQLQPSEILGLTFTRKATGELRTRLEQGLRALRQHGIIQTDEFEAPIISTYNSYASNLYRQYALLVGREPDATLLDHPAAVALMRQVVLDSDDVSLMVGHWKRPTRLALDALDFANTMRDNGVTGDQVETFVAQFQEWLTTRERGTTEAGRPGPKLETVTKLVNDIDRLPILARLADEYQARKRAQGVIEFSDQVATATEIIQQDPAIADEIRAQTKLVILDEYQDTSAGQTTLFAQLFRDHGVMAVGDPKQSIYAWRGASAGNMRRFLRDFSSEAARGSEYTLSTSWRNDQAILVAANRIADPLPESQQGVQLASRDGAGIGSVHVDYFLTQDQEAAAIADWFARRFVDHADEWGEKKGAVLVRARNQMPVIAAALAARGVPHRVIGLGGLLSTPEVVDLNCLLRAASDEAAGNELLRLLVGAQFEVGLADIEALSQLARQTGQSREIRGTHHAVQEVDSLAEALDRVPALSDQERARLGLSDAGYERFCAAAELLSQVRRDLGLPLVDLVENTIRRSRIDLEAAANPNKSVGAANLDAYLDAVRAYVASNPAADINEFLEWLEAAESDDQHAEVVDVPEERGVVQITTMHSAKGLEWDAVAIPQLSEGKMPKSTAGKGWFEKNQLPYPLRHDRVDLPRFAGLSLDDPIELGLSQHTLYDIKLEFDAKQEGSFVSQNRQRAIDEDRRLAYVAITRARTDLWVSSCRWTGRNKTPSVPSRFLYEAVAALRENEVARSAVTSSAIVQPELIDVAELEYPAAALALVPETVGDAPQVVVAPGQVLVRNDEGRFVPPGEEDPSITSLLEENPRLGVHEFELWPRPPMATDALELRRAQADQVASLADSEAAINAGHYDHLIDLMLAQRASEVARRRYDLPQRFGASYFHEVIENPVQAALDYARPMPKRPSAASLLGNLFHAWVESLFTDQSAAARFLDGLEPDPDEGGDIGLARASADDRERLEVFKRRFMSSRFAPDRMRPSHVELPIDAPLGDRTVTEKIDAVYTYPDGTIEIVDWKTGVAPATAEQEQLRKLQLMLYAHAYSESYGEPLERIRATLYYLADNREIHVPVIPPKQELLDMWEQAAARTRDALS